MNDAITTAYRERFSMVCDYIARHLDEPLTLEKLSALACCSPYHFHRQFLAFSGQPLYRYIQWLRLRRASWRLAFNPQDKVIDIALDAGFQSPESFSRAFRSALGKSPRQFRQRPDWLDWHQRVPKMASQELQTMEVKIVDFPHTQVAMLQHRGSPALVNDSAATFIAWRKRTGLSPVSESQTFGIAWDDPATTSAEAFRFDICGSVTTAIPENDCGVINGEIAGGRYAVGRHSGSLDNLSQTVWAMFRDWLPGSGETLRDAPVFFHYLNFINDVPEHQLQTDIYLPLR
ncbi:TPA: AraC family transcriptional regulator [Kluyvera cryocrescens]|uniref:AraC family transcriptional regulator n=1 Tax=Kluyvera cryocrescens TaxID=580 RepID=UPI00248B6479|nr:AraC family transcriptional regulator [Kluyvera cryocrescens]MEB7713983.1 AraC family transcriptional regulator [Kluyvera cryocrescens]WNN72439.1 AraC family transcriptional regulator [Kluyvera cryocrescens]HDG1673218.1 AraC family transcriptional regulator [Kluyvera cryocrescens]HDG1687026.1 AraC family transcriptional regulator [Kluyvera cryocrescens]HED1542715.1 AraC family transcriptional regulator [Kluyvera cryocrescens]